MLFGKTTVALFTGMILSWVGMLPVGALPLSPGDRLRIVTPADDELPDDSRFRLSGLYEVNLDGTIQLPYLEPQPAVGLEAQDVERALSQKLISRGFFKPEFLQLSVRVAQWAPVQVVVSGETYYPGRVLINARTQTPQSPTLEPRDQPVAVTGENPPERYLTTAIRVAGGFRPTADIRNVTLIRGDRKTVFDLSGIITGEPVPDVPLIAGDRILIPRAETVQSALARPSQLTPETLDVFISNLTSPSPRGGQMVKMENGVRFSQAVVMAGCAGGTNATNAKRRAVLVRTDRLQGQTAVVDRSVEDILKKSASDGENPLLLPLDSVVCYDSSVSNVSGIFRFLADIFTPFNILRDIFVR